MNDYRNHGPADRDRMPEAAKDPAERGSNNVSFPTMGMIVGAPYVKVRRTPNPDGEVLTLKKKDERMKILADEGEYYRIVAFGEAEGYILKRFVQIENR